MTETDNQKAQLLQDTLNSYKEDHRELSEIWRNLDSKSQGVITVNGIFLAGMFAFIRGLSQSATCNEKWLLTISAALLILSVVLALVALWVRSVPGAPLGESLQTLVDDILAAEDVPEPEKLNDFMRDHARMWKSTNIEIQKTNELKALFLMWSQGILMLSISVIVIFMLIKVWS